MTFETVTATLNPAKLYDKAMAWLESAGFYATLNPEQTCTAYHDLYIIAPPDPIKGITYPPGFKIKKLIGLAEIEVLQDAFEEAKLDEELRQFMSPLIFPQANSKASNDFTNHVFQRLAIRAQQEKQYGGGTFDLGISFQPTVDTVPVAFVPAREWFASKLAEVTVKDVFTIFPEAEQEMIQLFLGRVVVGRSGHKPVGWDKPIKHTARIMLALQGSAGCGKSTLIELFEQALRYSGYVVNVFGDFSARFGIGQTAASHFAFCDDITLAGMKSALVNPVVKQLVTNNSVRVEEKNERAYVAQSHCALLFNTNEIDRNLLSYSIDEGIADRFKVLAALDPLEINRLVPTGASQGSPSIYPVDHLQWLANKYDVDPRVIMLWIARLCADYFWALIKDEPTKYLWAKSVELTRKLRLGFDRYCLDALNEAIQLCLPEFASVPELSVEVLNTGLTRLRHLAIDPSLVDTRSQLKANWLAQGRPERHPWYCIRRLSMVSLDNAYCALQDAKALSNRDLDAAIKAAYGTLRTRDGVHVSHSPVNVITSWNKTRKKSFVELAHELCLDFSKTKTRVDHLYTPTYDPKQL